MENKGTFDVSDFDTLYSCHAKLVFLTDVFTHSTDFEFSERSQFGLYLILDGMNNDMKDMIDKLKESFKGDSKKRKNNTKLKEQVSG